MYKLIDAIAVAWPYMVVVDAATIISIVCHFLSDVNFFFAPLASARRATFDSASPSFDAVGLSSIPFLIHHSLISNVHLNDKKLIRGTRGACVGNPCNPNFFTDKLKALARVPPTLFIRIV